MTLSKRLRFTGIALAGLILTFLILPAPVSASDIDFGDNSSQWANDGECDDPRFTGQGMADVLLDEDLGRDANDCRTLYSKGRISLVPGAAKNMSVDFGDNSSQWANDGECDDPRFTGQGMADVLLDEDLGRDANDCRALFMSGQIQLAGTAVSNNPPPKSTLETCPSDALGLTDPLTCLCTPEAASTGTRIWGTDTYTSDSYICRAAVHAGQITASGGPVTLYPTKGQAAYQGSTRNGVSSSDWGSYGESFHF